MWLITPKQLTVTAVVPGSSSRRGWLLFDLLVESGKQPVPFFVVVHKWFYRVARDRASCTMKVGHKKYFSSSHIYFPGPEESKR